MSCHEFETRLVELARGQQVEGESAVRRHAHDCAACRARLDTELALTAGLQALANETPAGASPALEMRVLSAFDAAQAATVAREGEWRSWLAAAAAVAVLVTGLAAAWRGFHAGPGTPVTAGGRVAAEPAPEFVPWPGAAALPAFESGHLVRTELPASVLPLLGITPSGPARNTVVADVLVGQDGLARAVRVVAED
jgi:hypothetical protein